MAKLTKEDLAKIREREEAKLKKRDIHSKSVHVVVGMGTEGISAGAKNTLNALSDEISEAGLDNVILTQTGAIVNVPSPVVEVYSESEGLTVYAHVTAKDAVRIVKEHLIGGKRVEDLSITVEEA